jgi:hypothetical protein
MKLLSVQEYATERVCARQYVLSCLPDKLHLLYGVKSAQKIGKTWVLLVDEHINFASEKPNKPNTGKTFKKKGTNNKKK